MIDPKVNGPQGDGGIDGLFGTISETLGNLVRAGGDYIHEKFLTPQGKQGGEKPEPKKGAGKNDKRVYRGFEFWPITGIWAVGAAAAVVGLVLLFRKR